MISQDEFKQKKTFEKQKLTKMRFSYEIGETHVPNRLHAKVWIS